MVLGSSICQRTWIPPVASASVSPRILRKCRSREGRVSCSRRIPKVCSPVNLDRFIRPSLPRGGPQEPLAEYQEVRSEPSDLTRKSRSHSRSGRRVRKEIRYSFPVHRETQPFGKAPETRPLPGPNRLSNPAQGASPQTVRARIGPHVPRHGGTALPRQGYRKGGWRWGQANVNLSPLFPVLALCSVPPPSR